MDILAITGLLAYLFSQPLVSSNLNGVEFKGSEKTETIIFKSHRANIFSTNKSHERNNSKDSLGYKIQDFNDYIPLPTHLGGGGKVKGRASLQILVDENGKLDDVYIVQLDLKKGITPYISFELERSTNTENIIYPKKVSKYYPFLFNYIQKNFKFIKTGNTVDKINMIYIPIRLY